MAASTMANGSRTRSMAVESMSGLMEDATTETGKTTTCMEGVSTPGKMADAMKENTSTTESTATESMSGRTVDNTKGAGRMVNNTERVFTNRLMDKNAEVFGRMENVLSGLMNSEKTIFLVYNV